MFSRNYSQEKQPQERLLTQSQPLLNSQPTHEVSQRVQYGRGEYVSFAHYAISNITHNEKIFTRKFALSVYTCLFEVAVISGSNNPFSYRPELCLWIKNKMETLTVSDLDKLQEFVIYLTKFALLVEKYDAQSDHQAKFLTTLKQLFIEVKNFVSKRCPSVNERLSTEASSKGASVLPELPADIPKVELIGRVGREEYVVSDIKEGTNLFSAAFAQSCYKKLVDMSQLCGSTRVLYRYDSCIDIKELMEKSRIDWESYRSVIVKIPNEIRHATGVSGTEHFLNAFNEILKDIVDYVSTVRPELEKSRQDCLRKLVEESTALKSDLIEAMV